MATIGPQMPPLSRHRSTSGSSRSSRSSRSPPPSSSRRAVAGPQLPADFRRSRSRSRSASSSSGSSHSADVGPSIGPSAASSTSGSVGAGLSDGARLFLEREARRNAAADEARLAAERAASSRPEWMLVPPSLSNASSLHAVAGDPLNLKSRGFAQATPRVSARASGAPEGETDMSLWTETPQERLERMRGEVTGATARTGEDSEALERERAAQRDASIAAQVRERSHGKSLVEEHNDRRKRELQRQLDDQRPSRRRSEKHSSRDDDRRGESERRHRHRSRSPRDRHRDREGREPSHRSSRDEPRREHREHRERREHRDGRERDRSSRSEEKRSSKRDRAETRSRKQREEDEVRAGKASAPVIWDREAALSIGGRLMDEKKRGKLLADASALGDRFGAGSRRFL